MDHRRMNNNSIGLAGRRLLEEIRVLDERQDLSSEERETRKRRLACLILDLPEVAPVVREGLMRLELRADLSWEVRDHIIDRISDALMKNPEIATERHRLRGLIERLTGWGICDKERHGRSADGTPLAGHTRWAGRLDGSIMNHDRGGTSNYELVEDPSDCGVLDHLIRRERLEKALDVASDLGEPTLRTVRLFMEGHSHREIAEHEEVSENAIAKRMERLRKRLTRLGV